jgi:hypothetical protein
LQNCGIPSWYSKIHLKGAQQWHDEIGRALARCDWFLVVLSPAATKSVWVKRELVYALNARRLGGKIVPVLLLPCKYQKRLSWTLDAFQIIDFSNDFDEGCRNLLNVWGRKHRKRHLIPQPKARKTR